MNMIQRMTNLFKEDNHCLYEVGGHLRDELLGRPSHDIDLATDAIPHDTIRILKAGGFTNIFTIGIEYGTVGVIVDN